LFRREFFGCLFGLFIGFGTLVPFLGFVAFGGGFLLGGFLGGYFCFFGLESRKSKLVSHW
jgi:hypothetical protein